MEGGVSEPGGRRGVCGFDGEGGIEVAEFLLEVGECVGWDWWRDGGGGGANCSISSLRMWVMMKAAGIYISQGGGCSAQSAWRY